VVASVHDAGHARRIAAKDGVLDNGAHAVLAIGTSVMP
jgi:hypothetical protein